MEDLTVTEKRIVAIMLIGGRLSKQEFNTLCNTDDINKTARDRALDRIKDRPKLIDAIYPLTNA